MLCKFLFSICQTGWKWEVHWGRGFCPGPPKIGKINLNPQFVTQLVTPHVLGDRKKTPPRPRQTPSQVKIPVYITATVNRFKESSKKEFTNKEPIYDTITRAYM